MAKLSADLPVGAGIIVARPTPDRLTAWATCSTVMPTVATGTSRNETEAHLLALEAFLDHPDHADRRLTLDVEDTRAGREVARFAAKHLPAIPVTVRSDIRASADQISPTIWGALTDLVDPPVVPPPKPQVRIVGASGSNRVVGQPEAGWAWVTSGGRWRTGTIRNRTRVAAEVIAMIQLISSYPKVDSIHIGCSSKPVLAIMHRLRSGELGIMTAMADLSLHHTRYQAMFEAVVNHQGDITFQWVSEDPNHALTFSAVRLATHARRALQAGMPKRASASIQKDIISDLYHCLAHRKNKDNQHGLPD